VGDRPARVLRWPRLTGLSVCRRHGDSSIDHHRLLTRLTAAKLAIQLLKRRSDFSSEQRRLVRLANEAVDGLSADIRDHWEHSLTETPPATVAEDSRRARDLPGEDGPWENIYGALVIDPREPPTQPAFDKELVVQLQKWLYKDDYTFPSMPRWRAVISSPWW
jgi:hypothetical protein